MVTPSPSWFERTAYRGLGIRLDDRWRPWLEADLADPRWARRHRVAQAITFGMVGALFLPAVWLLVGDVHWSGLGGFVGAFIGQVGFTEIKRRQTRRVQLSENGPWISGHLPFPHRVVLALAVLLLVLALPLAWLASLSSEDERCVPASAFAVRQIRLQLDPKVMLHGATGVVLEDDFLELVGAYVVAKEPGEPTGVGHWMVRRDGTVAAWNPVAEAVTRPQPPNSGFSVADSSSLTGAYEQLRHCAPA